MAVSRALETPTETNRESSKVKGESDVGLEHSEGDSEGDQESKNEAVERPLKRVHILGPKVTRGALAVQGWLLMCGGGQLSGRGTPACVPPCCLLCCLMVAGLAVLQSGSRAHAKCPGVGWRA